MCPWWACGEPAGRRGLLSARWWPRLGQPVSFGTTATHPRCSRHRRTCRSGPGGDAGFLALWDPGNPICRTRHLNRAGTDRRRTGAQVRAAGSLVPGRMRSSLRPRISPLPRRGPHSVVPALRGAPAGRRSRACASAARCAHAEAIVRRSTGPGEDASGSTWSKCPKADRAGGACRLGSPAAVSLPGSGGRFRSTGSEDFACWRGTSERAWTSRERRCGLRPGDRDLAHITNWKGRGIRLSARPLPVPSMSARMSGP